MKHKIHLAAQSRQINERTVRYISTRAVKLTKQKTKLD